MNLGELRPGMEDLDLDVTIISLEEPREIETHRGKKHILVDGMVQDVEPAHRSGSRSRGQ